MGEYLTNPADAQAAMKKVMEKAHHAVFFGGAGVSTASGIPDFRSPNGLYSQRGYKYPPEEMLSHSFYMTHREEFFDFYRHVMCVPSAKPNQCHRKLAVLEQEGKLDCVITQNIDGLHQAAGSRHVIELHGSTHRNICQKCGAVYSEEWILDTGGVPKCPKCGGDVKPDVVLYEESLKEENLIGAVKAIQKADVLIIGGTSLVVYPAAGLVDYFQGDTLVVCNLEAGPRDSAADLICACDIAKTFDF